LEQSGDSRLAIGRLKGAKTAGLTLGQATRSESN
jgi:hypothetical protein